MAEVQNYVNLKINGRLFPLWILNNFKKFLKYIFFYNSLTVTNIQFYCRYVYLNNTDQLIVIYLLHSTGRCLCISHSLAVYTFLILCASFGFV